MIFEPRFCVWFLAVLSVGLSSDPVSDDECSVWTLVMDALKLVNRFITNCLHNEKCTGFTCNGTADIPGQIHIPSRRLNLSFGSDFMPCSRPRQLRITSDTSYGSTSAFLNITREYVKTKIPVATYSGLGSMKVHLDVGLQEVGIGFIALEMNATVSSGNTNAFNILPMITIPIPPCSKTISSDSVDNRTFTGIVCKEGTMHQCGSYQACFRDSHLGTSQCICVHGLVWNNVAQKCYTSNGPAPAATASSNVVVIVVCSLLSVVGAVVVMAIIVKYRRHRQRYGRHELLINNEGTDRDLDGDSPMLDG